MDSIKIYCVVVTYNGMQWIEKCFSSLIGTPLPLKILAIDNGSTDNTVAYLKENFPRVEVIETGENLGFGKANNIGLRKALAENADYVFLLNQDAWIKEDTIEKLVEVSTNNPEFGIISPFHLNWDSTKVDHYFLQMVNPFDCPDFLSDSFLKKQKDLYTVKFIHAACWLVSKECLSKSGGFDPLFYHYGEDNDYVNRARLKGFKIGICPSVNVFHYGFFDLSKQLNSNKHLNKTFGLLELKTLQNSLAGNYVFFFKRHFDQSTSHFVSRKFSKAFHELIMPFRFLKYYNKIQQAREASRKDKAFL